MGLDLLVLQIKCDKKKYVTMVCELCELYVSYGKIKKKLRFVRDSSQQKNSTGEVLWKIQTLVFGGIQTN